MGFHEFALPLYPSPVLDVAHDAKDEIIEDLGDSEDETPSFIPKHNVLDSITEEFEYGKL